MERTSAQIIVFCPTNHLHSSQVSPLNLLKVDLLHVDFLNSWPNTEKQIPAGSSLQTPLHDSDSTEQVLLPDFQRENNLRAKICKHMHGGLQISL